MSLVSAPARQATPLEHPPLRIADGTLEALKWLALALMIGDHVNTFVWQGHSRILFELGRVSMPLFGFVLAYNLARPEALENGALGRTIRRLLLCGTLSTPLFVLLVGWWPLNILFTLALAASVMLLSQRGGAAATTAAAALFIAGGAVVEFGWFGVATCLAAWAYCRAATGARLLIGLLALASLTLVNGSLGAMLAPAVIGLAHRAGIAVGRRQAWFYAFYPAHLALLVLAQELALHG